MTEVSKSRGAMKVAAIQMNSQDDKKANMAVIRELIVNAVAEGSPDLVVTPEYTTFLGGSVEEQVDAAEDLNSGETLTTLASLAKELAITLHVGSVLERSGASIFNTSVVFGPDGTMLAKYRKIHLFDVVTPSGHVFKESDVIGRGEALVSYDCGGAKVGCSICYDLRFSELFVAYAKAGADIIAVPAAFNFETGAGHWTTLCRARAIETQAYVVAAAQVGKHRDPNGESACFGNTMIVDPWGKIIASCSDTEGWITAEIDFQYQEKVRSILPVNKHRIL